MDRGTRRWTGGHGQDGRRSPSSPFPDLSAPAPWPRLVLVHPVPPQCPCPCGQGTPDGIQTRGDPQSKGRRGTFLPSPDGDGLQSQRSRNLSRQAPDSSL